jgi:hypothetical protein
MEPSRPRSRRDVQTPLDLNTVSGDFGRVEVLVAGSPAGSKSYNPDVGMASDQFSFSSPGSGTQAVAMRVTLHVEPQAGGGVGCDVAAGAGFFVDDLRVVRAP